MHTIREQRERLPGGYGIPAPGEPTGKWEIGIWFPGGAFQGSGFHVAATCDTRDEAIEICRKLNGGDARSRVMGT